MLPHDGGTDTRDQPTINLVRFGSVERDLIESLARSMESFLKFVVVEECVQPVILRSRQTLPEKIPDTDQGSFLLSRMGSIPGRIVIGVTDIGFFDSILHRYIFGYGSGCRGVLSTLRFRKECENGRLLYERLNKEIIKILALACGLCCCNNEECILVYHQTMHDLDRNTTVCPSCREKLVDSLQFYLGAKNYG